MKYHYLTFDKKLADINLENLGRQGYRLVGFSRTGNNWDYIFMKEMWEEKPEEKQGSSEDIVQEIAKEASDKMAFIIDEIVKAGVGVYELVQTPKITPEGMVVEFKMKRVKDF